MTQHVLEIRAQRRLCPIKPICITANRRLLLAIAAMIIGISAHPEAILAFDVNPSLTALSENTAIDQGPFTDDPYNGNCGPAISVTDYSRFVYDSVNHQMLLHGGGHSAVGRDDVVQFDFSARTWRSFGLATPTSSMTTANYDQLRARWISTNVPVSAHTFDLMAFAPNTGELIRFRGGSPSSCWGGGYDSGMVSHYNPSTKTWSFSSVSTAFADADYPGVEYDPGLQKIVVVGRTGLWVYDPVTKTNTRYLSYARPEMSFSQNLVYYPPTMKHYYIVSGSPNRVWEVTLDRVNLSASTVVEVTGMINSPSGGWETGWAYDTNAQIIGGGIKDGVFRAYHPPTKTWTSNVMQIAGSGGSIGSVAFHALDYNPVDNVFLFITDGASGGRTWAYRYRATTASPPTSAEADFQARCSAPGVVRCVAFDNTTTDIVRNVNLWPDGNGVFRGSLDTVIKASGAGSLKFELPPGSSANIAGQWSHLVPPYEGLGTRFHEGSTFYVQFRQRFSPEMLTNTTLWSSRWKQVAFYKDSVACAAIDLTTAHFNFSTYPIDFPIMYTECGARTLATYTSGGNTLLMQQGDYSCKYGNYNPTDCFLYPANTWITFYYKVHIGVMGQPNSSVEAWVALPGQPYKKWIDQPAWVISSNNTGDPPSERYFNNITFLPYMTSLTPVNAPTAYTWYDELVVSTQSIQAPGPSTQPTLPTPPTSLIVR